MAEQAHHRRREEEPEPRRAAVLGMFGGRDHPVGAAVEAAYETLLVLCGDLIAAARHDGTIPGGPPPRTMALAFVGAVEGLVMQLYGHEPDDELLAERAVLGLLAADPPPV